MKLRILVAAIVVPLVLAAATATASVNRVAKTQANTLTVWLQVDAQSGWPDLVAAANQKFQADHPGWNVNVQYQNWSDHLQKFDATLAGGNTPDVIEMGNTEMVKYMAAGAFADISASKSSFDNSANWLKGLAKSGMYGGKLVRRAVLRRLAGRHVSHRPVQEGRDHEGADQPRGVHGRRCEARGEELRREGLLAGVHGRYRLVLRDELRLRLRRPDRLDVQGQVGRRPRHARTRSRA